MRMRNLLAGICRPRSCRYTGRSPSLPNRRQALEAVCAASQPESPGSVRRERRVRSSFLRASGGQCSRRARQPGLGSGNHPGFGYFLGRLDRGNQHFPKIQCQCIRLFTVWPKSATGALNNLAEHQRVTATPGTGHHQPAKHAQHDRNGRSDRCLPNGNLVVVGRKEIMINSERQVITLRGIVRPDDLSPVNSIPSDRVARMEILVNGKGVVNDATKRPFFLYRLLLGLLPF